MAVQRFPITSLRDRLQEPVDLFICSASYEARCHSIADQLAGSDVRSVLIAQNENHRQFHGSEAERLKHRFPKAMPVRLDTTDPLVTADNLAAALSQYEGKKYRVLVDVTTFTHEALLILFCLMRRRLLGCRIQYVYTGASEYSVGDPPDRKWLSKGIGEIRSVLGYPGRLVPSKKLHLIVLVGFEPERVAELIRRYEPSVISLGSPDEQDMDSRAHHAASRYGIAAVTDVYGGEAHRFRFGCFDALATRDALNAQRTKVASDHNVVIAAMNTKISTLGAALAAMGDDSIQLCYAQAVIYNYLRYSMPGNTCYLFDIEQ